MIARASVLERPAPVPAPHPGPVSDAPARARPALSVLQVDPGLFTAPYDAGLDGGLRHAGVTVGWATRGLRPGEEADLPETARALTCYRLTDGPRRGRVPAALSLAYRLAKGAEHALDLGRVARLAESGRFDLVHFQWALVPRLDRAAMQRIRRTCPVVMTVHDTTPLNGKAGHALQRHGFDALFGVADHLIVHTATARDTIIARGVSPDRISVIAHGPLGLRCAPRVAPRPPGGRWRLVLFGRLQSYKGVDLLVEALALIPPPARDRIEVVIAGEPMIDLPALMARADALGLGGAALQLIPRRLDEQAMADLLAGADGFVFPYRAIEASGVLYLVAGLGRWIIASDLGAFGAVLGRDGSRGQLVPPGDAAALAKAMVDSIGQRPAPGAALPGWDEVGRETAALYRRLLGAAQGAA